MKRYALGLGVVQGRATTELNIGTFVGVSTLFCALQFPPRLVPERVVAAFGFARLLPQLERTFPYLLFGWLGHDEFSQSRRSRPGQEAQKAGPPGAFYVRSKQPILARESRSLPAGRGPAREITPPGRTEPDRMSHVSFRRGPAPAGAGIGFGWKPQIASKRDSPARDGT